jgi:tripartite-type tricarboxylate transporter receptor subunit TctC
LAASAIAGKLGVMITRRTVLAAAAAFAAAAGPLAHAQTYPDRPIKLVLPFTPGSPNDVLARLVAPEISSRLGQPIVIDNRPGGGTSIGTKAVMGAEADGYTLLFSNTPTLLIVPVASQSIRYDALKDILPVASVATSSNLIVISPSLPAHNVKEFVAYAKAHPGKLNFGFGQGTQPQLVGEMFKHATGTNITDIPYKGGARAIPDLLGGRIQMNIGTVSTLRPLHQSGKVRAIAYASTARSPLLPDVPTMVESGYPSVVSLTHYAIFAPPGVPAPIVSKINSAVNDALKSPELQQSLEKLGFSAHPLSQTDFVALVASENKKWVPIVKTTGFQM